MKKANIIPINKNKKEDLDPRKSMDIIREKIHLENIEHLLCSGLDIDKEIRKVVEKRRYELMVF